MLDECYKQVFERSGDGVLLVDSGDLKIWDANPSICRLTSYTRNELKGKNLVDLSEPIRDKRDEILENPPVLQKLFASLVHFPLRGKNGDVILVEGGAYFPEGKSDGEIVIMLREITERRQLEQQLRQAEKMSALGQLISGVAHELNNPLAVIGGYSQLLTMRAGLDDKTRADMAKIQRESERASRIVQNFLSFARKHPMERTHVNLNELVEFTLELIDYDLRASGVRLIREFEPSLPEVFADLNQLEQVILNIVHNAVHAMEKNQGEKAVTIRTESSTTDVKVIIRDTGTGVDPSILGRVFDPFFTTKEVGVGTGLGLSISYGIIKEHGGEIRVSNHVSGGAVFTISLPISEGAGKSPKTDREENTRVSEMEMGRGCRILVVDDEPSIQEFFTDFLASYHCEVISAGNGMQALRLIQNHDFDLIICDLKMPVMDGRRFYDQVREINSDLSGRFLFITGDTNSARTSEFLQATGRPWLSKPFQFNELEALVIRHFQKIQERKRKAGDRKP